MKKVEIKDMSFSDTADIELFDPSDDELLQASDGTIQSVTVYGPESSVFKEAKAEMMDKQIGKHGAKDMSAKQIATARLKMLVAITKSFNGVDFGKGLVDVANAKEEYKNREWFKKQVDEGAGEYGNFPKASGTTSSE